MELNYFSDLSRVSDDLRRQPNFMKCIREIEEYIKLYLGHEYKNGRYKIEVSDNEVNVELYGSFVGHLSDGTSFPIRDRSCVLYKIGLDENKNFVFQRHEGNFKNTNDVNSETVGSYLFEREVIEKDSSKVLMRQKVGSIPNYDGDNKFHIFDGARVPKMPYDNFEYADECFKNQLNYVAPEVIEEYVKLNSYVHDSFVAWSANRNKNDDHTATVYEFIHINNENLCTKSFLDAPINGSALDVMRIDPPYAFDSYSEKLVEEVLDEVRKMGGCTREEFQQLVSDCNYGRNTRGRH